MIGYTVNRLLQAIPILFLISLFAFGMIYLIPGDAATVMAGPEASAADLEEIRRNMGLDQPFYKQIVSFYVNLFQGDLGKSLMLGTPVVDAIADRTPITLGISLYSLVVTIIFGLVTGIVAALNHNKLLDQVATLFALIGISLPNFWLGLVMIVIFSVHLGWLPTGGYIPFSESPLGWLRTTTMPAVALALLQAGLLTRITRSTMLEVLSQDYIRTARAKGLSEWQVIGQHALSNVMMPVVTVLGLILSVLISGSIVIEAVFGIPGLGALMGNAILSRDFPLVQGGLISIAASLLLLNIVVDILYFWLDPRVHIKSRD